MIGKTLPETGANEALGIGVPTPVINDIVTWLKHPTKGFGLHLLHTACFLSLDTAEHSRGDGGLRFDRQVSKVQITHRP